MSQSQLPETPPLPGVEGHQDPIPADEFGAAPLNVEGPLAELARCRWCGGWHPTACPYIKRVMWHENGQTAAIDLLPRLDLVDSVIYDEEDRKEALEAIGIEVEESDGTE